MMRYVIQYRSLETPDAGWSDMALTFYHRENAEQRMVELQSEFYDKEWQIDPRTEVPPYTIGNSGTH